MCQLDCSKAQHSFHADFLHATAAPDAQHALPAEQPVLLRTLQAGDMPKFLHDFQFEGDEQVDLRRKRPSSRVWEQVLTKELSVDDLDDDQVVQLGYLAPGKTAAVWARTTLSHQQCADARPLPACRRWHRAWRRRRQRRTPGGKVHTRGQPAASPEALGGESMDGQVCVRACPQARLPLHAGLQAPGEWPG